MVAEIYLESDSQVLNATYVILVIQVVAFVMRRVCASDKGPDKTQALQFIDVGKRLKLAH
jgi:hypothetical protein